MDTVIKSNQKKIINLRPSEILYLIGIRDSIILLQTILIDLINRNILEQIELIGILNSEKGIFPFIRFNKTDFDLNDYENKVIEVFNNREIISFIEFMNSIFILDDSCVGNQLFITKKIKYFIKKTLCSKKVIYRKMGIYYYSKFAKKFKKENNTKIKNIEYFHYLSKIYKEMIQEDFYLTIDEYKKILFNFNKAYSAIESKVGFSMALLNRVYPEPVVKSFNSE